MLWRNWVAAAGLALSAVVHSVASVDGYLAGSSIGRSLALMVYAVGCSIAVYGLIRRCYWARCMTLGIGLVALTQISVMGIVGAAVWTSGVLQWVGCLALVALMTGSRMRAEFEERPGSTWNFESGLARLARAVVVAGIGAIPMLFWMAANAVYSDPMGPWLAAAGGVGMIFSLLLVVWGRTVGLMLLSACAGLGAFGTVWSLLTFDTSPCLASQQGYWLSTVGAAGALVPGVLLGTVACFVFVPRMIRHLRST